MGPVSGYSIKVRGCRKMENQKNGRNFSVSRKLCSPGRSSFARTIQAQCFSQPDVFD